MKWNAVNPTSEKPKFGRGNLEKEMNFSRYALA